MSQFIDEVLHELRYYSAKNRFYWDPKLNMKKDAREEWIEFMMEYYKKIWPDNEDHIYRRWAVGQVDKAAESLGDYFSRSYYETYR
jgi:hypothetical protein